MKGNKKGKKKDRKHRKRTRVKLNNGNYKLRTRERNVVQEMWSLTSISDTVRVDPTTPSTFTVPLSVVSPGRENL